MQVIRPDAPISATERVALKKLPEQRPTADSSRFTGTWVKRASASSVLINSAIQSSGRLATSLISAAASSSAMRVAASFALAFNFASPYFACAGIVRRRQARGQAVWQQDRECGVLHSTSAIK